MSKQMAKTAKKVQEEKSDKTKAASGTKKTTQKKTVGKTSSKETSKKDKDIVKLEKKLKDLQEKLHKSEEKTKEHHDKYVRLSAEFDNYRKRTLKEKSELVKSAGEQVLNSILPVIDDFERGLQTIDTATELDGVKEGIHLIYNKFSDFLTQNGIKEIECTNKEFNTDLHEAITKIPAPKEDLKDKIVDVIQKGYTLNDKVIRFSKVVIGE